MSTKLNIGSICIDHIGKTEIVKEERTENLTQSAANNFVNGMVAGVIGQIIPSQTRPEIEAPIAKGEMPITKAMVARFNGVNPTDTICLTAEKTETVVSSCWGPGFNHPVDFHYHHPAQDQFDQQRRPDDPRGWV